VAAAIIGARRFYDWVILDMHPDYGPLNQALFAQADKILVPSRRTCRAFALRCSFVRWPPNSAFANDWRWSSTAQQRRCRVRRGAGHRPSVPCSHQVRRPAFRSCRRRGQGRSRAIPDGEGGGRDRRSGESSHERGSWRRRQTEDVAPQPDRRIIQGISRPPGGSGFLRPGSAHPTAQGPGPELVAPAGDRLERSTRRSSSPASLFLNSPVCRAMRRSCRRSSSSASRSISTRRTARRDGLQRCLPTCD